ncbi:hypothetical protein K2173_013874 [Erythroxylum novogranatense]|uniref:Bifunctional inhibitor/plant lipid transfer protein/seed storage helical domain-containing protein n=1 Tax=Erythroxylum novogranatense TaxID=1862640 RepID=A0AAV8SD41_9ROSI|nr:hypothetical protein K2173_013874 [Erythroxylum novogranatense]
MYTLRLLVTAIVAAVFVGVAAAQHPTQAPSSYMGPSAKTPLPGFGPSASGPTSNYCITPLSNMTGCLSFAEEGSHLKLPDKDCCPELAGLLDSNPICLCQLLSGGLKSFGISIDLARALKLPSLCRVSTPPVSMCSAAGYPVAAPTPSEMSMPPGAAPPPGEMSTPPGAAPTPSEMSIPPGAAPPPGEMSTPPGSASVPSTGNNKSEASSIAGSSVTLFLGLAFAAYLLTFF